MNDEKKGCGFMEDYDRDEAVAVAEAMQKYGGSFVQALGKALVCADIINSMKIKKAFPVLWLKYKKMGGI